MSRIRDVLLCMAIVLGLVSPVVAQESSTNGVNGGYTGSDPWFKSQRDSAAQRGTLERNLGRRKAAAPTGAPEVELQIVFPEAQQGVANIEDVTLVPQDAADHDASALGRFDRTNNAIKATFISRKDLRPGHAYAVFVTDSRANRYGPVGTIKVAARGDRQAFKISAPMIAPSQQPAPPPHAESGAQPGEGRGYVPPGQGERYVPPQVGPGYVRPQVGPGYVPPGSR